MSNLTKETIDELLKLLPEKEPSNMFGNNLFGIPIIPNPHIPDLVPVIELSDKVNVSDEFRKKTNQYYICLFGYKSPTVWKTQYGYMMGPNLYNVLATNSVA